MVKTKCIVEDCYHIPNTNGYCSTHIRQIRKHGHVLPRKPSQKNEVECSNGICKMAVYNKFGIKKGELLFSQDDLELLKNYKWDITPRKYGYTKSTGHYVSMARLIMNLPDCVVDHINGDVTDNRRCNLRTCSIAENVKNKRRPKNNTSGYKGVSWDKNAKKWSAFIMKDRKHIFLGYFNSPEAAAYAYNEAAYKYHGEFACYNQLFKDATQGG